jgi:drug/metabolite transporter (DMT)-like permease
VIELAGAGALWGFGFVAAVWSLEAFNPFLLTFLRFAIAAIVGAAAALFYPSVMRSFNRRLFFLAMVPGLITLTLILQTFGLKYTTATKSSFVTTLYVLMVPMMDSLWRKKKLQPSHWFFVVVALLGVGLICDFPSILKPGLGASASAMEAKLQWNFGDFLTFLCAIAASLHIVWIGGIESKIESPFSFNILQSAWAAFFPLILVIFFEGFGFHAPHLQASLGLFSLSIGSTLIGFALQVRAQKVIPPALASLLFLLESPFAALFAFLFLSEHLRWDQWLGAAIILSAIALSVVFENRPEHETSTTQA